jgi:hypothetical protein
VSRWRPSCHCCGVLNGALRPQPPQPEGLASAEAVGGLGRHHKPAARPGGDRRRAAGVVDRRVDDGDLVLITRRGQALAERC